MTRPGGRAPLLSPPATSNASEKTLLVLEAVLTHDRFTDVVAATGLAKATVHRILMTLVDARVRHACRRPAATCRVPRSSRSPAAALAADRHLGDRAALRRRARGQGALHRARRGGERRPDHLPDPRPTPTSRTGCPRAWGTPSRCTCTGIGKVVLSTYSDEALDRFAARAGLPAPDRAHDHRPRDACARRSATSARSGYARDREENVPGIGCVAAPIRDHTGKVSYGLSISTITLEHSPEQIDAMSADAIATADQISRALGWRP